MREIKFRVWDKKNNKMLYSPDFIIAPLFSTDGKYEMVAMQSEKTLGLGDTCAYLPIPEQSELMQYTGIKDKNGREIYEGDIVRACPPDEEWKGVVEFEKGAFVVNYGSEKELLSYELYNFQGTPQLEVIGNIYESPELLEEEVNHACSNNAK